MPNFVSYHQSITDELHALKDRIRNLSRHWPTDGEFKEAALRMILRRHLPESVAIGRGFVVTQTETSSQLDLLVVDTTKPTLFKDGDLFLVTPDAVKAVVEVKTRLRSVNDFEECVSKLARVGKLCHEANGETPWLGLFCYDRDLQDDRPLLDALKDSAEQEHAAVNAVAYGRACFIRFWPCGDMEPNDAPAKKRQAFWRSYELSRLASSYFVGNLVDSICRVEDADNGYAWFPLEKGKHIHRREECRVNRRRVVNSE